MSRFRRALAGVAMAVALAGGALFAGMAGAAPAHAATAPTPAPASHTFSFSVVPAAQAGGGIGPKLQCGDTCDPNGGGNPPPPPITITCTLSLMAPFQSGPSGAIIFDAGTLCDGTLPHITQAQDVQYRGSEVDSDLDAVDGRRSSAHTRNVEACRAGGQWQFHVSSYITLPPGWVILSGTNPIVSYSPIGIFECGSGGGGGGGCATGTPSVPAQPAARLPMVVTC
jgi:hypothetical protein